MLKLRAFNSITKRWRWISAPESSYISPIDQGSYIGNNVTINDNGSVALTWDIFGGGVALLDLEDSAAPTIITAGIYSVAVTFSVTTLTVDGSYRAWLKLNPDGFETDLLEDSSPSTENLANPLVTLTGIAYLPVASKIIAQVISHDGTSAQAFKIRSAFVQRIT